MGVNFVGILKVGSYFMAGHDIPDAMPMHPKVLDYLNLDKSQFESNRNEGELATGRGLAFGSDFELNTGDLEFIIFYAQFELGFGYDIMLLDYGPNAYCKGRNGSLGMNGWYAKGQAYAYFGGKIGIKVKVFGKRKNFEILDIRTAAALRIEGPNPTSFWGCVGGRYSLLGGMVKGNCKFEVSVGEKCDIQQKKNDLSDLTIIGDLSPMNDSKDVNVFSLPQAVFNMPVEKEIKISGDTILSKTFKVNLKEYSIYQNDIKVEGSIKWNENKTTLAFTPEVIFNPNCEYKIFTKVSFVEKIHGRWEVYKDENGSEYVESKNSVFTTGELPGKIPEEYIKYSYPIDRQANFYRDEYKTAYITFIADVAPFFKNKKYKQMAKWSCLSGEDIYKEVEYIAGKKSVETSIPKELSLAKFYKFMLVNVPVNNNQDLDRNVKETKSTAIEQGENTSTVITRLATETIDNGEEKAFYEIDLRTSKYAKFLDKIPNNTLNIDYLKYVSPAIDMPGTIIHGTEMFDKYELYGTKGFKSLIMVEAILENANWYQKNIYPLMYKDYPLHKDAKITNRNLTELGVPPTKNIELRQTDGNYLLSDADIDSEIFSSTATNTHFIYTLSKTWASDYMNIRNKIANLIDKGLVPTSGMSKIINKYPWPQISIGNYPIRLDYVLPGRNTVTSTKVIILKNNIEVKQVNLKALENSKQN